MLETVATCCRGLACEARLVLLYHLAAVRELRASELAERACVPRDHASQHFRRLVAADLLHPRRSGRSIAPGVLVRKAFLEPQWATQGWERVKTVHLSPRAARVLPEPALRVADVVFDAATAFAHVRRLQILRFLDQCGARHAIALGESLHMSPQACWRHLDKLRRRGYVSGHLRGLCTLSMKHSSPFHSALLCHAREDWGQDLTLDQV